jgi:hypothetical protein
VISDGLGVSDSLIAVHLGVRLPRLLDIALTNCRGVHCEHRNLLLEPGTLAGGARGRVSFENERLKLLAAILAFEIVYRHGRIPLDLL